ncbi:MAG: VCBS repeat-containing protein [Deltaproteobacteria bacterium]|nr:VCBS repeat-containing protein [Nannocystaceae bacterium]
MGEAATDAADTTAATVTTSAADESGTGESPTLCLSTVAIDLDTTDGFIDFADVDGDARPELWRRRILRRRGQGADASRLDAFLVELDGSTTPVGTHQFDAFFSRYADVDGDGGHDLVTELRGARSWHRGQADSSFALPQPIAVVDEIFESWLDADGDGDADVFASQDSSDASVTLYLGDGGGELTNAGTAEFPIGAWITSVVPTPEPGVFVATDYNGAIGFGVASSYWRIAVDVAGVPTAVVGTPELPNTALIAANDLDDDGVTDILTIQGDSPAELHLWTEAGDGYVGRTVAVDVAEVAVGEFLGGGGVELLFTDLAGSLWLLPAPIEDGAEPLAVEGMLSGIFRVIDLGGDGQDEVVSAAQSVEGSTEYAMHNIVPCS